MSQFHKSTHCLLTSFLILLHRLLTSIHRLVTSQAMYGNIASDVWMLISGVIDVTMSRLTSHVLGSVTNDSAKVLYFTNQ